MKRNLFRIVAVFLILFVFLSSAFAETKFITAEELYALMSPAKLQSQKVLYSSYVSAPDYQPSSDYCMKVSGEEYWLKGSEMSKFYEMVMGGEAKGPASGSSVLIDPEAEKIAEDIADQIDHRLYHDDVEFWKVEFGKVEVAPFEGAGTYDKIMVSVYLTWQANNGEERTKKMLRMFSDDLSATLANNNSDSEHFVADLWFFWTVPVHQKDGYFAKYHYQNLLHKMYLKESLGPLYGKD